MKLRSIILAGLASLVTAGLVLAQTYGPGVNTNFASVWTLAWEVSTGKPTFSASSIMTPAASAADVCTLQGSATKTVRVRRVLLSGISNAVQTDPVSIIKRNTTTTGGTSALVTAVRYDSTTAVATAVVETYSANGTSGTVVGALADVYMTWANTTTGTGAPTVFEFGRFGNSAVLNGSAQQLAVSLDGQTFTSGKLSCTWEWTEE